MPSCGQHLAIGQQRRRVAIPSTIEAAGVGPSSRGWIVKFRARESAVVIATCDKNRAIGEQCRSVELPTPIEAAGDSPSSRGWIVNFRAREKVAGVTTATSTLPSSRATSPSGIRGEY